MTPRHTVWTVGHSNHEFDHFARLIANQGIEFIVDVRSFPYSRFVPRFNREDLQAHLSRRGVRYLFLGEELGGRPTREDHYDSDGHALYGPMSEEPQFRAAIDRVLAGAAAYRLALMCSEGEPRDCHRRLLVGRVLADRGVELRHVLPDGSLATEISVEIGVEPGQGLLFGEARWRSSQSVSRRRRLSTSSSA